MRHWVNASSNRWLAYTTEDKSIVCYPHGAHSRLQHPATSQSTNDNDCVPGWPLCHPYPGVNTHSFIPIVISYEHSYLKWNWACMKVPFLWPMLQHISCYAKCSPSSYNMHHIPKPLGRQRVHFETALCFSYMKTMLEYKACTSC
jgi:hypothetical protein